MIDTKNWTVDKIYQEVGNRQLAGAMFHSDAVMLMSYLGLKNLSKIQQKRRKQELDTLQTICLQYLNEHGCLLKLQNTERIAVISTEEYRTPAEKVGNEYKRKALAGFMEKWGNWEQETALLLMAAVSWCVDNCVPDMLFFKELLSDVCSEKTLLHDEKQRMELSNYDILECNKGIEYI